MKLHAHLSKCTFMMNSLTWVMEGHKQKGSWAPGAACSALDDGVSADASSGDLLKHAACSVHDKDQCWNFLHTEQPVEIYLERHKQTCFTCLLEQYFKTNAKKKRT